MSMNLFTLKAIRYLLERLPNGRLIYKRVSNSKYVKLFLPNDNTLISTRLKNGVSISVDVKDYNGRMLYLYGLAYPETVETCQFLLNKGDTFLDIGANYGVVGLMCHDIVGSEGSVHLFEPQPKLCTSIGTAIRENDLNNVSLHKIGLMDRDGTLKLAMSQDHTGEASFVFKDSVEKDSLTLEVKDIKTYLPPLLACQNFGAKVDVEGAELYLLPWLLKQNNLKFIVFENTHISSDEKASLLKDIKGCGFTLWGIENRARATMLRPLKWKDFNSKTHHDVLCSKHLKNPGSPDAIPLTKVHELLY